MNIEIHIKKLEDRLKEVEQKYTSTIHEIKVSINDLKEATYKAPYVVLKPDNVKLCACMIDDIQVLHSVDDNTIGYAATELCVAKYPNIRLDILLNGKEWVDVNLNGLEVNRCVDHDKFWHVYDDYDEDEAKVQVNWPGRYEMLYKHINELQGNMIYLTDLSNIMGEYCHIPAYYTSSMPEDLLDRSILG